MRQAFLALVLVPGVAAAQTSNCQWVGNVWQCRHAQDPWDIMRRSQEQNANQQREMWNELARRKAAEAQRQQELQAQQQQQFAEQQQRDEADRKAAADARAHLIQTDLIARYGEVEGNRRFRVLSMLAELVGAGRCDSARILADRDGDDQMRKSVAEECAPAGPPTSILP